MERRANPRFDIRIRCEIAGSKTGRSSGMTLNMSRHGVLISLDGIPPFEHIPARGEIVEAELELPTDYPGEQKCLKCFGVVVRASAPTDRDARIALQVHQMDFRTPSHPRAVAMNGGEERGSRRPSRHKV
jgi:hypothetical protein